ncbi:hypothetical protein NDU88_006353 [Pleurodeles waltl]|uniref:Uncharacterized protein n=1 Tax=Pleurodeles waltl TaxID=8319 RepID=A0AAV7SPI4_PLEWA|nr:hypothetical protein NDU88_006353 [Pleurodeles waltl]
MIFIILFFTVHEQTEREGRASASLLLIGSNEPRVKELAVGRWISRPDWSLEPATLRTCYRTSGGAAGNVRGTMEGRYTGNEYCIRSRGGSEEEQAAKEQKDDGQRESEEDAGPEAGEPGMHS